MKHKNNNLSNWDLQTINMLARRYTNHNEVEALNKAKEMLALCITEEEIFSVLWWWNEGCRDYAHDMKHLEELNQEILK